ncbi:MAG: PLP-dependent transferase, partial [Phycisphaerae bacterium]|nr:PLP-dependent transferase [Phycisphaerae bacterium]
GGMLAFEVGENQEDAKGFVSALQVIRHAVSLGSTESLICIPFLTTMLYMPPERRTTFGVKPNTVRLSIGIEPVAALLADIDEAVSQLRSRAAS